MKRKPKPIVKKIIVITECTLCPQWLKCKPSRCLSPQTRFYMLTAVGLKNAILKKCPLSTLPTDEDIEKEARQYDHELTTIAEGVWVPHGFIIRATWMKNKINSEKL